MKHHLSKFLSLLLVTAMLLQILPASIFATESTDEYLNTLAEERPETAEEALASAQILFEEESLREESVKHFRLDDGTYIAVDYGTPVHYEDDGEWVDYDNTLKAVNSLDGRGVSCYRVDNGNSTRVFASSADADVLLAVQKGNYGLAFAPIQEPDAQLPISPNQPIVATDTAELVSGATVLDFASTGAEADDTLLSQVQPDKFYSALEYENAINGATLRYENYGNTIKESIVISEPQSEYVYSFTVETDGLTAELQEDGSVNFATTDGTVVYYIPAPYMIDANNEYSYDAAYVLTGSNGSYTLTVTADPTWLNDEPRAFPVLLDPTIIEPHISGGSFSGTFVRSGAAASTAGSEEGIFVGDNGTVEGITNGMTRGYFHADSIPWLPIGSEVFYAEFSLWQWSYQPQTNGATSLEVGLYPMEVCPNPGMSSEEWQGYIADLTWSQVNSTYLHGSTLIDKVTVSLSTNYTYSTWNITNLARKWYGEYNMNLGFALIAENEETVTSRVCFYGPRKQENKPIFMVAYRSGVGVEDYYSYQTLSIGRAGTSYISDYTLQNTLVVPIMTSDSTTMPFSLSMVYNSVYGEKQFDDGDDENKSNICTRDFSDRQTGAGWKLSIQQTIIQKTIEQEDGPDITYLVYNDADGTEHYFVYSSLYGAYVDLDGLGLKITVTSSGYTMENDYGYKKIFRGGYLVEERDAHQNKLIYEYNANQAIITVKRQNNGYPEETIALIGYNNYSKQLTSVVSECDFDNEADKAAHRTSFDYDAVGDVLLLTEITFPDNAKAQYSYYLDSEDEPLQGWVRYRLKAAYDDECDYGIEYSYSYNSNVRNFYEFVGERTYGAKVHGYKRSHNMTVYRYYGDDGESATDDDFLTFVVHDAHGRPVTTYTTDATEKNILGVSAGAWSENAGTSRKNNRLMASVSSGLQSVNLLLNGTMEDSNYSTIMFGNWEVSSSFFVQPGLTVYEEEASAAFIRDDYSDEIDTLYQSVVLEGGKTYTFSAYVKIADVSFNGDGGIYLVAKDNTGEEIGRSECLNYSTQAAENGWMRQTVCFSTEQTSSYTVSIEATNYQGTIFADAAQLEEADAASTFNLVENGSFEVLGATIYDKETWGWYSSKDANVQLVDSSIFGSRSIVLSGTGNQRVLQRYNVNFPSDSTFILTGWAKANADPNSVAAKTSDSDPFFGLIIQFYYSDSEEDVFYYPFDPHYTDWQYVQGIAVPQNASDGASITKIHIAAAYDNNFGTAYMDNISLRMEPVQSYTYDNNGNLVTTAQAGTGETVAAYTGVDLTSYTAANGSTIEYVYNNKHDITSASIDGVTNDYIYDYNSDIVPGDAGNLMDSILWATTADGTKLFMKSMANYTDDGDHTRKVRDVNNNLVEYEYASDDERLTSTTVKVVNADNSETARKTGDGSPS